MSNSATAAASSQAPTKNEEITLTIKLRPGKPADFKYPESKGYRWGMIYFVKSLSSMTAHYMRNHPDHHKEFTKHYNAGHVYVPSNDMCGIFEMESN